MVQTECGQLFLCPPESRLLAEALGLWCVKHADKVPDVVMLHAETLRCAFQALALATVRDWYITPADEAEAHAYVSSLLPKEGGCDHDEDR
jgi:hypothetical protein